MTEPGAHDRAVRRPVLCLEDVLARRATELAARARRLWVRGEARRAVVLLGEACHLHERDAARWVLYAAALLEVGRRAPAIAALKQALWLRQREHDVRRAAVTRALLERVTEEGSLRIVRSDAAPRPSSRTTGHRNRSRGRRL